MDRSARPGQLDPEPAALAFLRDDAHAAAHAPHGAADDRETDAGARIRRCFVQPLEDLEDLVVILRRDADAVVLDPGPDPPVRTFLGPDDDLRLDAFRDELD